jgi:hypothetical protein
MSEAQEISAVDQVLASLKELNSADLMKIMKAALNETEKKTKAEIKSGGKSSKKENGAVKGAVPPQLRKPKAWVDYVLHYSLNNGWEAFVVSQKNKETEEVEEIEMKGSILHDGCYYVYDGSVTEKNPQGKQIIHKEAMSLSKQYWSAKERKGTREDLYRNFEKEYVEDVVMEDEEEKKEAVVKKVRKTAEEKEAEQAAKKAAKEAEKAAEKAAKEAAKAEKKAAKEAEKAAEKAAKEAAKAEKKAAKDSGKKSVIPAGAIKKLVPAAAVVKKAEPKKVEAYVDDWKCEEDGLVYPWNFKGKSYFRNCFDEVWAKDVNGECGAWQGKFVKEEGRIDDSFPEPEDDDE